MDDLLISGRVTIPAKEIDVQFARSGGPGGQNVNKLNTKVTLRWRIRDNPLLPEGWRERAVARYKNRLNTEGELVLHSERYRLQRRNLEDCRQKLKEMLLACKTPPVPRKATRPTLGSQRRRVDAKRRQSEKKRLRGRPPVD